MPNLCRTPHSQTLPLLGRHVPGEYSPHLSSRRLQIGRLYYVKGQLWTEGVQYWRDPNGSLSIITVDKERRSAGVKQVPPTPPHPTCPYRRTCVLTPVPTDSLRSSPRNGVLSRSLVRYMCCCSSMFFRACSDGTYSDVFMRRYFVLQVASQRHEVYN